MKLLSVWVAACLCLWATAAEQHIFRCPPWELTVAADNGAWTSLKYQGEELLYNPDARQTLQLTAGESTGTKILNTSGEAAGDAAAASTVLGKERPLTLKLVNHSFDAAAKQLTLQYQSGNWNVTESINFEAEGRANRIRRTAKFQSDAPEDLKFQGFQYLLFFPLQGEYYFPATFLSDKNWREDNRPDYPKRDPARRTGSVRQLQDSGNDRIKFSVISPRKEISLLAFADSRYDNAVVRYNRLSDRLECNYRFSAHGWALPGAEQQLLGAYLQIEKKSPEETINTACPQLLNDLGLTPPADRPDWVADASIYGVMTEPFYGEKLSDIPDCVIPRMKQLGFNTVWYRPVEASTGRYSPIDYLVCEPKIGNWADYRAANDALHANNMRALEDLVPHGGGQLGVLMRGQNAKMLSFTESGAVFSGWACDFNQPDWQKYMESVAEFYSKEQCIDGFRIDAIFGSKTFNWRKKNFPSSRPHVLGYDGQNSNNAPLMLAALWDKTMKEENGELPALEYPRASLALSAGGLNMLEAIRRGARRHNPESAMLLECAELPFTAAGDMHYDRDIQSLWFKLRTLPAADFVEGLSLWLDEQQAVDAPGTIRMRYMETGIGESWPYRLWFGLEADKAIRSLCFFIHGVPMCYEDMNWGEGTHLSRLNHLRNTLEPLRRGAAHYRAVQSSDNQVFTVLRNTATESVLGVINFSPHAVESSLTVPPDLLPDANGEKMVLKNAITEQQLAIGNRMDLSHLSVKLRPFESALYVWKKLPAQLPQAATVTAPPAITLTIPTLKKEPQTWIAANALLELRIDQKTGLAVISSGKTAVTMDLLRAAGTLTGPCRLAQEFTDGQWVIRADYPDNTAVVYRVSAQNVQIEVVGQLKTSFSFSGINRWQLDSFGGMLDDILPEHSTVRTSFPTTKTDKERAMFDRTMLWSSLEQPIDRNRPELRIFGQGNNGMTVRVETPENTAYLYNRQNDQPGLFYIEENSSTQPAARFAFFAGAQDKETVFGMPYKISNRLTLRNLSYGWQVENDYYIAELLRSNGTLIKLVAKTPGGPVTVLQKENLIADSAMTKGMPYACSLMDPETTVELNIKAQKLSMSFAGDLRAAYKNGSLLRLFSNYHFDDSPEFLKTMTIRTLKGIAATPAMTYQAETLPFNKWLDVRAESAAGVADVSKAKRLTFRFFDQFKGTLEPQKDYMFSLKYRTDGQSCTQFTRLEESAAIPLMDDPGFEKRSMVSSQRRQSDIPFFKYEQNERLFWVLDNAVQIRPGVGRNGSAGVYMGWPNPKVEQNLNPVRMEPGTYRLRFSLKGRLSTDPDIVSWSNKLITIHPFLREYTPFRVAIEYSTVSGEHRVMTRDIKLPKEYDWQDFNFDFEIAEPGFAPFVTLSAMPEYAGELYLDDLKWEQIKTKP